MKKLLGILPLLLLVCVTISDISDLTKVHVLNVKSFAYILTHLVWLMIFIPIIIAYIYAIVKSIKLKNDNNHHSQKPHSKHSKVQHRVESEQLRPEVMTIHVKSVPRSRFTTVEVQDTIRDFYVPQYRFTENLNEVKKRSEEIQKTIISLFDKGFKEDVIFQLDKLSKIDDTSDFLERNPEILKFIFA